MKLTGFRGRMVLWCSVLTVLLIANFGGPILTRIAYAFERGKQEALHTELDKLSRELADVQRVSRAFNLVSQIARPGVVQILVGAADFDASYAKFQLRMFLGQHDGAEGLTPEQRAAVEKFLESGKREDLAPLYDDPQRGGFWRTILQRGGGSGSGIVIDTEGYVLTNNHVVAGRQDIEVLLSDDRKFPAKLVGTDPKTDLAVVKVDAPDLHPLPLGDSDQVQVGDWVIAIGAPFGLTQTVTHGIVSAVGRAGVQGLPVAYQNFIQTDAAINPGNSGGPLLNLKAEVIGVNTAIAASEESKNAGVAFVVPSRTAKRVVAELRASGVVSRGWLGVNLSEVDPSYADVFGLSPPHGVLLGGILKDLPADKAGLEVDDVIIAVDGNPVKSVPQLQGLIGEYTAGARTTIRYIRDGVAREADITLEAQPDDMTLVARRTPTRASRWIDKLGFGVRTFRPGIEEAFEHDNLRGVIVREGTILKKLENAILLVEINDRTVKNVADLRAALATLEPGSVAKLKFLSPTGDALITERTIGGTP